nr:di-heme oxidoredictase family protein [Luteimonas sp. BDR2-5]
MDADEAARFDLGHAVFNTSWVPAGQPAGRRDGLGPLFNSVSCDACHNSRRRGRGPLDDGPAPSDFVLQVGQRQADGGIARGHPRFGHVVNTDAVAGFVPEAAVSIRYRARPHARPDGSRITLWSPAYQVETPDGAPLPDDLVLMPRMAPSAQGVGLLEAIPDSAILAGAQPRPGGPRGEPAWIDAGNGRVLGRFGWQGTEATVASQVAVAFAREMGLTSAMIEAIDCASHDDACRNAAHGGTPEVEAELFEAVLAFQRLETVRRTPDAARRLRESRDGARLFANTGCGDCHRSGWTTHDGLRIDPYTDLLLHDLGDALADRDIHGTPLRSRWRTAPLWGISTALEGGRPIRLLHDGRARSIEEAIAWHGGAAAPARARFDALHAEERQCLIDWVSSL